MHFVRWSPTFASSVVELQEAAVPSLQYINKTNGVLKTHLSMYEGLGSISASIKNSGQIFVFVIISMCIHVCTFYLMNMGL